MRNKMSNKTALIRKPNVEQITHSISLSTTLEQAAQIAKEQYGGVLLRVMDYRYNPIHKKIIMRAWLNGATPEQLSRIGV